MSEIRPAMPTNDSFSPWANSVYNSVREKSVARTADVLTYSTPFGTNLSLQQHVKYAAGAPNYKGEWNITSSYSPGDIVRVLPKATPFDYYRNGITWAGDFTIATLPPGNVPSITGTIQYRGQEFIIAADYYVPIPGTYICVAPVPSYFYVIDLFLDGNPPGGVGGFVVFGHQSLINASFPVEAKTNINYIRAGNINYFPVWPEMSNIAYLNTNDLLAGYNGRYWDLISLLPTQTHVCSNGIDSVEWTDTQTVPSGSANFTG